MILASSLKKNADGPAVLIGYYIILIVFSSLVVFGTAAYYFHNESLESLDLLSEDTTYWDENYPNMTPEEVAVQRQTVMQNIGLFCLAICGLLLITMIPFTKLAWAL